MMPMAQQQYVMLSSIPAGMVYLVGLLLVGAWIGSHRLKFGRARPRLRVLLIAVRLGVGFGAVLAAFQAVQRVLVLATNWPLWLLAMAAAGSVELVVGLYAVERGLVSKRVGMILTAFRTLLVLAVVGMLAQPVHSLEVSKLYQRYLAILVDDSGSMQIPDKQLGESAKIRLAETLLGERIRRRDRLETVLRDMARVRREIIEQGDWLAVLRDVQEASKQKQLARRREVMSDRVAAWSKCIEEAMKSLTAPLSGKLTLDEALRNEIGDVKSGLSVRVHESLTRDAAAITDAKAEPLLGRQCVKLLVAHRRASAALGELAPRVSRIAERVDEAFYRSLSKQQKDEVEAVAGRTRFALARDVLTHRPRDGGKNHPSLLERCMENYNVRLYTFSDRPREAPAQDWQDAVKAPSGSQSAPATGPAARGQPTHTDLAAALRNVASDVNIDQLAGVILLSDGRHNTPVDVGPVARRFGDRRVPVCSVLFGGAKAPVDAAVISAEAPDTIYLKDKTYIKARLKLDGLAGRKVRVALHEDEKVIDTQEIQPPSGSIRMEVRFAAEPKTVGAHRYRVLITPMAGEVFSANNEYPITVTVTDERTKMLIIEGRPRWEFRYLKNLFTGRDRTVQLQYVLFEADSIGGTVRVGEVPADVSRAAVSRQATALPVSKADWMKFDVIVLGDVDPSRLPAKAMEAIGKFVAERGGTLIVIAGPAHMPHGYQDNTIKDLLPVLYEPGDDVQPPSACKPFRIALTAEGLGSVIMQQAVDEKTSRQVWDSLPELYWRDPGVSSKHGASVLAYAVPQDPPDFLKQVEGQETPEAAEQRHLERQRFQRANALIAVHNVALGRVMFLAFDRTWRLRYRVGDLHHHKFWGQVLRWATGGKLPAGTAFVRMGTDRFHYPAHERVRVRVRMNKRDFSPLITNDAAVRVFRAAQPVLRKKLEYVADSPGIYSADLGELPGGAYHVELDAPAARALLELDKQTTVKTEFSVDSVIPAELFELAADRGRLSHLAGETGGVVVEPARAGDVMDVLSPGRESRVERRQYSLWDSWPLLALLVLAATGEWLLRKKAGLS